MPSNFNTLMPLDSLISRLILLILANFDAIDAKKKCPSIKLLMKFKKNKAQK